MDVGLNKRITLRKPLNLSRGRFSLTTHLKVASTFDGRGLRAHTLAAALAVRLLSTGILLCAGVPEFGLDIDNVKPVGLVAAAAAVVLAIGLPLSGGKTFGDLHTRLPAVSQDALSMVSPSCLMVSAGCTSIVI